MDTHVLNRGVVEGHLHHAILPFRGLRRLDTQYNPLLMAGNPQCSLFPNNCYTQADVERWFSDGEVVFAATSQSSVYAVPSILSCHKSKRAQEQSLEWFPSNAAIYAPAIVTQFPDAFLSSDPSTEFVPQWELVKEKHEPSAGGLFEEKPDLSQVGLIKGKPKHCRTKRSSRKRHTVTRESRWCNVCNKEFTRKHDLFRHITAVHGKLKPFPCRFGLCESAFPRKDARDVSSPAKRSNWSAET